ncbi:MAG: hypothetical protein JXR49_20580 [Acidobacteria bacterium]|nr:hypothetical protein [Acidobacteriota bacterium]
MGTFQDSRSTGYDVIVLRKELLGALETARSRLAIAIAEESKSTPWDLRRHYLETTDHMRRFIERLRKGENHEEFRMQDWMSALEALREISLKDSARPLCSRLRRIVAALE